MLPGFKNVNWLVHNTLPGEGYKLPGFVRLDINDHSLGFAHCDRNGPRIIERGQFTKHFQRNKFLTDHNQVPWANVDLYSDPNDMWKEMFLTNGILLLCKSQHFTERQLVMIKKLYPLVSAILIAFRTYNMIASIDISSFICSLYILLAQ